MVWEVNCPVWARCQLPSLPSDESRRGWSAALPGAGRTGRVRGGRGQSCWSARLSNRGAPGPLFSLRAAAVPVLRVEEGFQCLVRSGGSGFLLSVDLCCLICNLELSGNSKKNVSTCLGCSPGGFPKGSVRNSELRDGDDSYRIGSSVSSC